MSTEQTPAPVDAVVRPYTGQRAVGSMVCTQCGNYSSSQFCWTCVRVFQAQAEDMATIGFLIGCLEGLKWRVDEDGRKCIDDALERARNHYSA